MKIWKKRRQHNVDSPGHTITAPKVLTEDSDTLNLLKIAIASAERELEAIQASAVMIQKLLEQLTLIQSMLVQILMVAPHTILLLGSRIKSAEIMRQSLERAKRISDLAFNESAHALSLSPFPEFLSRSLNKDVAGVKETSHLRLSATVTRIARCHLTKAHKGSGRVLAAMLALDLSGCVIKVQEKEEAVLKELERCRATHRQVQVTLIG